jgi:DNA polymerase-3 subunit gamma/tau
LSRCQRFDFRRIALREIVQRLEEISRTEGLKITKGALQLLAREADGSMRDAQSLLEQVFSFSGADAEENAPRDVDERLLRDILGLTERRTLFEMSRAVIGGDAKRCLGLIAGAVEQGLDLTRLSKDLVEHFRNLLVARLAGESDNPGGARTAAETVEVQLFDLPDQEMTELKSQVAELPIDVLLDYFELMAAGDVEIGRAENPRFCLETLMVRLATLPHTMPVAQLIERLEQLEKRLSKSAPASLVHSSREVTHQERAAVSPEPPEREAVAAKQEGGDAWRDFVSFVAKEKKVLATQLEAGSALELGAGILTIGVPERHQLNYLQDGDNMSALKALAEKFFSRSMTIHLTQVPPASGAVQNAAEKQESSGEGVGSELVKEALRIFGGSIKAVRQEKA